MRRTAEFKASTALDRMGLSEEKVFTHNRRIVWGRTIRLGATLLALWSILAPFVAGLLIVRRPLVRADAIVVLSGAATFHERTEYAARVFNEGRSSRIILTNDNHQGGWSTSEQRNPYYYERATAELVKLGVPRQEIEVILPTVSSTYDEAVMLRQYCENHAVRSLLVVTSAYHSRRALWTFEHVFKGSLVEVGLEAVGTGIQTPQPFIWWVYPRGWQMIPTEYLKMAYYWVRFR